MCVSLSRAHPAAAAAATGPEAAAAAASSVLACRNSGSWHLSTSSSSTFSFSSSPSSSFYSSSSFSPPPGPLPRKRGQNSWAGFLQCFPGDFFFSFLCSSFVYSQGDSRCCGCKKIKMNKHKLKQHYFFDITASVISPPFPCCWVLSDCPSAGFLCKDDGGEEQDGERLQRIFLVQFLQLLLLPTIIIIVDANTKQSSLCTVMH